MTDILKKSFLVDTNILVYSLDKDSLFHERAANLFSLSDQGKVELFVSHQNVLELINTLIKDYGLKLVEALKKTKNLLYEGSLNLIHPLPTTLNRYFRLTKSRGIKSGNIFDYYLAATALDNGVESIVTNNPGDYRKIKDLNVLGLKEIETLGGKIKSEHE